MKTPPLTLILRHRRENLRKCSLAGLETRSDLAFYTYPTDRLPPIQNILLLKVGAPVLTTADREFGLLLVDGTWRLAEKMIQQLPYPLLERSLPVGYKTAYPRRQTDCPDPEAGLSSLEALYVAHTILGRNTEGLLDHYHWKDLFLSRNGALW